MLVKGATGKQQHTLTGESAIVKKNDKEKRVTIKYFATRLQTQRKDIPFCGVVCVNVNNGFASTVRRLIFKTDYIEDLSPWINSTTKLAKCSQTIPGSRRTYHKPLLITVEILVACQNLQPYMVNGRLISRRCADDMYRTQNEFRKTNENN